MKYITLLAITSLLSLSSQAATHSPTSQDLSCDGNVCQLNASFLKRMEIVQGQDPQLFEVLNQYAQAILKRAHAQTGPQARIAMDDWANAQECARSFLSEKAWLLETSLLWKSIESQKNLKTKFDRAEVLSQESEEIENSVDMSDSIETPHGKIRLEHFQQETTMKLQGKKACQWKPSLQDTVVIPKEWIHCPVDQRYRVKYIQSVPGSDEFEVKGVFEWDGRLDTVFFFQEKTPAKPSPFRTTRGTARCKKND